MTRGATVAVHGGKFGDLVVSGLQAALSDTRVVAADGPEAEDADVLASMADDRTAIEAALRPGVRWVHVLAAGVDGFPLDAVGDRVVTCSRGASAPAIAEFVLAAMLAFEKRLPDSWISAPPERWNVAELGGLAGRRLGVVGLGAIGTEVARRALSFEMEVVATRRRREAARVDGVELAAGLDDLLSGSDHVVVAAPATPATARLFDETAFSAMKPGAHFVNVSRGTLVDQDALLRALDSDWLARATLDVVDPEPLPDGHPLYRHPRVRLSPHISWSSPRTARKTFELFAANLDRFRRGAALAGRVDPQAGY